MRGTALQANDLTVMYGSRCGVQGIDLTLSVGEGVALIGRNGAGKSSLLRALAGLEPGSSGSVLLHGQTPLSKGVAGGLAYVPQRAQVRWDLPFSVIDVVLTGRYRTRRRSFRWSSNDRRTAHDALYLVDASDLEHRSIGQISGGQAQRVLLARALVQEPEVMLLDEPFAGLDTAAVDRVAEVVESLMGRGIGVMCALHELDLARRLFPRAIALQDGRLLMDGSINSVLSPHGIEQIFTVSSATS